MLQYLVLVGAVINLSGASFYIRNVLKGTTKPNRVTYLMWTIAPLIAAAAAIASGVTRAAVPVFVSGFGPLLILIASFISSKAYWELHAFDYFCGAFSLLALILWAITKQPDVAIVFAILSDIFAGAPTLVKAWRYPDTETGSAYLLALVSVLTTYFAIKVWTFPNYGFAVYLTIMDILLVVAVFGSRFLHRRAKERVAYAKIEE